MNHCHVANSTREVQAILMALATLDTIAHPSKGLYRDRRVEDDFRPSARFAARIAAAVQSAHTKE
jgi:hypothetical protein